MFGFLFKVILMAAVVAGAGYGYINRDKIPQLKNFQLSQITSQIKIPDFKQVNASEAGSRISSALDNLVTHPDKNSPVILGVKITNESIGKVVDVIQGLPPEQVKQIQQVICATPSAQ